MMTPDDMWIVFICGAMAGSVAALFYLSLDQTSQGKPSKRGRHPPHPRAPYQQAGAPSSSGWHLCADCQKNLWIPFDVLSGCLLVAASLAFAWWMGAL